MSAQDFQNMYEKMEMPKDMDERIRERMEIELNRGKVRKGNGYRAGLAVAAAFAVMVCITQFDTVSAAAQRMVEFFKYTFVMNDEDGKEVNVDMKGGFVTLLENAPKEDCYMDSMQEAGNTIGVKLLDTDAACMHEDCVQYTPYLTEDGELYGVMLSDKLYAVGDLQDVTLNRREDMTGVDSMTYQAGTNYQTPVSAQITIRTDKDMTGDYDNNEIGYVSKSQKMDLTADADAFEAEVYELEHLGAKAVLYTIQTDGPVAWNVTEGTVKCTVAVFVYEGVEYVYMGGMNHDTMKAFLDTLK